MYFGFAAHFAPSGGDGSETNGGVLSSTKLSNAMSLPSGDQMMSHRHLCIGQLGRHEYPAIAGELN
jgi:hypothetical protein